MNIVYHQEDACSNVSRRLFCLNESEKDVIP